MEGALVRLVGRNQLFGLEPGMLRGPHLALAIEPVAQIHARGCAIADRHPGASGFQLDHVSGLEIVGHFLTSHAEAMSFTPNRGLDNGRSARPAPQSFAPDAKG